MNKKIMFLVTLGNAHVFTYSLNREYAKRAAFEWLGHNPDNYTVTPLTSLGDRIHLAVSLDV